MTMTAMIASTIQIVPEGLRARSAVSSGTTGRQPHVVIGVVLGKGGHRKIFGSTRPGSLQSVGEGRIEKHPTKGVGQRVYVAWLDQHCVDVVGRDVAVTVEAAGHDRGLGCHRLDQHDPERLTVQRRRAEHIGAAQPGHLVGVGQPTEPLDSSVIGKLGMQSSGIGSGAAHPQSYLRTELAHCSKQNAQTFALLVATTEENGRTRRRLSRCGAVGVELDTVVEDVVVAADVTLHELGRVFRHRNCIGDVVRSELDHRPQVLVAGTVAGGVERRDNRCGMQQHCSLGRPRNERLVQMEYVELLVAERPHGAQRAGRN